MIVKVDQRCCPACENSGCDGAHGEEEIEVDISTAELLAELEKRRPPCKKCASDSVECCVCKWGHLTPFIERPDNFVAKKGREE